MHNFLDPSIMDINNYIVTHTLTEVESNVL